MRDLNSLDVAVQGVEGELDNFRNAFRKAGSEQSNTYNSLQRLASDVEILKAQVMALKEGLDNIYKHLKESNE